MRVTSIPLDGTNPRQHNQQSARAINALISSNYQATTYGGLGSPLMWSDANTYVPGTEYDGPTFFSLAGTWRCMGFVPAISLSFFVRTK